MSILTKVRTVPRTAISGSLRAARLPLTTYESVLRRGRDNTQWRPAVAFEDLEGSVRRFAGTLLRDEELTEQGKLARAKVAQLRKASELDDLAEQERLAAKAELEQERQRAGKRRKNVQTAAEKREAQLDRQRDKRVEDANKQASERKQQVEKAKTVVDETLDKADRAARLAALDAEAEALETQREAVATQGEVMELDKAIDQLHAARTSGT